MPYLPNLGVTGQTGDGSGITPGMNLQLQQMMDDPRQSALQQVIQQRRRQQQQAEMLDIIDGFIQGG